MYYIQESAKPKWWEKIFKIIGMIDDKLILPITKDEEIDDKQAEILAIKIKEILRKTGCKKVCVSKTIKAKTNFIKSLQSCGIETVQGKWLFKILTDKILEYALEKSKLNKRDTSISILINKLDSDYMYEHIKKIIREYKSVNIVTNDIGKFKKIEEQILEKEGIVINVTSNKKKGLMRSQIILNVDFPTNLINQCNIPDNAVIINLNSNIKINRKRFNGINIIDYEIKYLDIDEFDYDKYNLYYQKDIYEAKIYQKQPYEYIKRKIERDKVEIVYLQGSRNKI